MKEIKKGIQDNSEYEELLLLRENIKKEAVNYQRKYFEIFGDLITNIFERKINCIKLKKSISYCQKMVNHNEIINQDKLKSFLQREMEEYNIQFEELVSCVQNAKNAVFITRQEAMKVKKNFREIAKLIHPDIHTDILQNEKLYSLWMQAQMAYQCNQLEYIEEILFLIKNTIKEINIDSEEIVIPNLNQKIEKVKNEIEEIKNTDPYQYKFLLMDKESIELKIQELKEELESYTEYEKQLEKILNEIIIKSGGMKWIMKW